MADIQSNIDINIDASDAISSIKNLQREISAFHQSLRSSGSAANAAISNNMTKNLVNSINATKQFSASLTTVKSSAESFTESLEKNKMSMGQYFKYAAGSTKTFGRLFSDEFNTIQKVAESRVKTLQTQFVKLGREAGGAIKAIKVRPLALDMENLATKTAIAAQKQQLMNQLINQGSTNLLNFGKNTQWAGRQLMVGFTVPLTMLGSAAAKTFMEMEKSVVKFKRVYGDLGTTISETDRMVSQLKGLAQEFTKYGVAVSDTMEMAAQAAAMGKMGAELTAQVAQATKLAVLGGVDQSQALETTISLTNSFGIAAEQLSGKVDFLNAVENQTVTSIEDLTIAIPKAGPVIQQLGGDVEDLAFFLTAMKEGGINASEGANALKSGIASMINPTKKVSEFLAGFGVNLNGIVEANKGDIKGTVIGFAKALDGLDPLNRARAIEQLFGKFQFARISTLFQNITKEGTQAQKVLGLTSATSEELAILSERELKKVENSPMFKFQKAIEDIKVKLVPLGEAFLKMITPVIEFGTQLLDKFNAMGDGVKNFIMGTIAVLGGLAPAAIMAFGLIANGIANLIKGGNFLRNVFLNAGKGTSILGQQTQYMSSEQLEAAAAAASLDQAHQNLTQQFTAEASAVRKLISAYNDATAAQARFANVAPITRTRPTGKAGGKTPGYKDGILSVPGPKGAGDIVPAMLAPGEAVIPADVVSQNRGFIAQMMGGKLPGFENSNISQKGRSLSVGGKQYILHKPTDARMLEQLKVEAERLHGYDPEAAAIAMTMLEDADDSKDAMLKKFRKKAVLSLSALNGTDLAQSMNILLPGKENADQNKKARSEFRGNPNKNKSILQEVTEDPKRRKEFLVAARISKAAYQEAIAMGMSEEDARNKTEWNPQAGKYGVDRSHKTPAGIFKMLKELWTSTFVTIDPKIENGLLSTLERSPGQAQILKNVMDDMVGSETDPKVKESLSKLRSKIASNQAFSEEERRTFARVINHLHGNVDRYTNGIPPKDIDNFKSTVRMLDAGYRAAKLETKSKLDYRVKGDDPEKEFKAIKDRSVSALEKARDVALSKNRIPQTVKTKAGSVVSYARRVMRLNKGIVSVPGPKGAGDVVPAMLSPGEAVIPAGMSEKYAPLISGMVDGTIPGYSRGKKGGKKGGYNFSSPTDDFSNPNPFGGDSSVGSASSPFGDSNYNFDTPASNDMGWKEKGKTFAGGFISSIGNKSSIKPFAAGFIKNLNDGNTKTGKTASRFGKLFGLSEFMSSGSSEARAEQQQSKDGKGRGRASAAEDGSYESDATQARKDEKTAKKELRAQRSGRIAQAGMGLSMAVGMATAVPGAVGQAAQQAIGPISAMTAAMSILPGPIGLAVGAIGALVVAVMQFDAAAAETRKKTYDMTKSLGASSSSMKKLAEFAGTVSASELADKRRDSNLSPFTVVQGKTTFGQSYVQSEAGQAQVSSSRDILANMGGAQASKSLASQLIGAVATSIITPSQAKSIAQSVGASLNNYGLSVDVIGQINEILDEDGNVVEDKTLTFFANIVAGESASGVNAALKQALDDSDLKGSFAPFWWWEGENNAKAEGMISGLMSQMFQEQQTAIDGFDKVRLAKIQSLKDKGDFSGALAAEEKYEADRLELVKTSTGTINSYLNKFDALTRDSTKEAIVRQIIIDVKETHKEDKVMTSVLDMIDSADNVNGMNLRAQASIVLGLDSGTINPETMTMLTTMFDINADASVWTKVANIDLSLGSGTTDKVVQILDSFSVLGNGAKATRAKFIAELDFSDPATTNKKIETLQLLSRYDNVVFKPGVDIKFYTDSDKEMESLMARFDQIDELAKKGPLVLSTLISQKLIQDPGSAEALAQMEKDFAGLTPGKAIQYAKTYTSRLNAVATDEVKVWKAKNPKIAKNLTDEQIASRIAHADTMQYMEIVKDDTTTAVDPPKPQGDGTKATNPLDDLLSRLKQIRQAAVNASGGMKELSKWMKAGALERKGGGLVFSGMNQQLDNKGYNKEFIDFVTNAEAKVRKTYMSISKTGVVTLTKEGVKLQNLFNALKLGEYQQSVASMIKSTKEELSARKELLATGMSYQDAVEAGRDSGLAEAIAAIKASTNIKNKNAAIKQTIELYKQAKAAAESVKTAEEKFGEEYDKISKKFEADKNAISLKFEVDTSASKKVVAQAQSEIEAIRYQLDDYNAGLTRLQPLEDEINKKYEDRQSALDKIRDLNQKIADQQRGQLDLADALSKGDISAAAKAAQEMRSKDASNALDLQSKNLDMAKEQELKGLRVSVNGVLMSREEIEKNIKKLEMDIFEIEEARLEPAQRQIDLAAEVRDKAIAALDDQKREWDLLRSQIDLAKYAALDYASALKAAKALASQAVTDNSKPVVTPTVVPTKLIDTLTPAQQVAVQGILSPAILNAAVGNTNAGGSLLSGIATQIGNGNKAILDAFVPSGNAPSSMAGLPTAVLESMGYKSTATPEPKSNPAPSSMAGLPASVLRGLGYYSSGGFARGTDTIPAMLTPGEFVVKKYAVDNFGVDKLKAINNGTYDGNSVYNYNLSVNLNGSNMNATDVADTVIARIRQIDSQKIRGNRL